MLGSIHIFQHACSSSSYRRREEEERHREKTREEHRTPSGEDYTPFGVTIEHLEKYAPI